MTLLSKNKAKFIKSLHIKKYRKLERLFLVEGTKSVLELLNANWQVIMLCGTEKFHADHAHLIIKSNIPEIYEVSAEQLSTISTFIQNQDALAVVSIPDTPNKIPAKSEWWLALENIQDPGNLGTILRVADWYGITNIVASTDTAELYNPKVIQASMGSFLRVHLQYDDLNLVFDKTGSDLPIYGAMLQGENIHRYKFDPEKGGIVVIGNEANGISEELAEKIDIKISIPRFGRAESLNAGIATGVILDNLRRNN